jgi:hypothetical protein
MDWFTLFLVVSVALYLLKVQEQRQRVLLLASFLGGTQIEKLLGTLMDGYLRAAGEQDPQRQAQVWAVLAQNEESWWASFSALPTILPRCRTTGPVPAPCRWPCPI